jgi:hypothetical protein
MREVNNTVCFLSDSCGVPTATDDNLDGTVGQAPGLFNSNYRLPVRRCRRVNCFPSENTAAGQRDKQKCSNPPHLSYSISATKFRYPTVNRAGYGKGTEWAQKLAKRQNSEFAHGGEKCRNRFSLFKS